VQICASVRPSVQPHRFCTPPPAQVRGASHVPQLATVRAAPQWSVVRMPPQSAPASEQSDRSESPTQLHTLGSSHFSPQLSGALQVPQPGTLRGTLQRSVIVAAPQSKPSAAQSCASVRASVHPQRFCVPAPPQVWGAVQVPQLGTVPETPHRSVRATEPHCAFAAWQSCASVSPVHPHRFCCPPPLQVFGAVHVPQETVRGRPQRSVRATDPHSAFAALHSSRSVSAVQPQRLGAPAPPQAAGAVQVPQETVRERPQRSVRET